MFKRINTFCCLLVIFVIVLSSCSPAKEDTTANIELNNANVTAPGELPIVNEKITLTIGMPGRANVIDYDTNEFTKWLEEQTNIDLEFMLFPESEANTKLELMLASDTELPDIIMGMNFNDSFFQRYAESKSFLDLTEYIDQSGYWINKMFEEAIVSDLRKYMVSADGKMYYMPYLTEQNGNIWPGKTWINKVWLDKLGLDMPKTTEEFRNVLSAFKTKDPNGNGIADEIPMSGVLNGYQQNVMYTLMNSFIYCDQTNFYIVDNGKLDVAYNKEEWREGLRYMSELMKEGLIDVQSLIQDSAGFNAIALNPDINILGCFSAQGPDMMMNLPERMGEYVAMPPLKGPKGVAYSYIRPWTPSTYGLITKDCENPLAAFRLMDFMLSEEAALRGRYGVPGVDWEEAKETDKCMFENIGAKARVKTLLEVNDVQNSHWASAHPTFRSQAISDGMTWDGDPLNVEYIKALALPHYMHKEPKEYVEKQLFTEEETEEITPLATNLKTYVKEYMGLFVSGEKDLDSDWDAYVAELEKIGLKRYLEISQAGYDRFNK